MRARLLKPFLFAVLFTIPVIVTGQQAGRSGDQQARVYDATHKDYHNWDKSEDQAWRKYLSANHLKYRDYAQATTKEQTGYWGYRHQTEGSNDQQQTNNVRADGTRSSQNQRADDRSEKR